MTPRARQTEHEAQQPPAAPRLRWRGLLAFAGISLVLAGVGLLAPLDAWLGEQGLQAWARRAGWWGPPLLLGAGAVMPLVLLPRWPLAVACGLLYGVPGGVLLANSASLLGAWLQYRLARGTLGARTAPAVAGTWRGLLEDPARLFVGVFLLRAFPFSSHAATNVLAGALRVPVRTYLSASFLGMLPSSILYAAWGRLLLKPSPSLQALVAAAVLLLVGGAWLAARTLRARRHGPPSPPDR